jgi:hypothetical protein
MSDKHDVFDLHPFDRVHDVEDVGPQIHGGRQQVGSLAESCERRRHDLVAIGGQPVRYARSAPSAVPGPVHKNEIRHLIFLSSV